ncbi:anthranilate synthase component II [Flavobacterium sp. N1719]|uniref:anthranilate synthase component II n=1 Tax=Flavobacterium sp. N1719 TaxID=2885633 RepID=UPI0022217939|nr:aminodeoxychorismate/anthranilate synthase component II [Flavobacterium sp. N1719]
MKPILLLDNYDSFTFNLVHYLEALGAKVIVYRNDEIELDDVEDFDCIVLSPGPGLPSEAGILIPLLTKYAATKNILGICLGMQAIGEVFGGKLANLNSVYHGIATPITITEPSDILYQNLPSTIEVGRYHSWTISPENFPIDLVITAQTLQGEIMSIRHQNYNLYGVQYHPESILTPFGKTLLDNWLQHFYFKQ